MTADFKKWLYELAEENYDDVDFVFKEIADKDARNDLFLTILIKAMWAINRELVNCEIQMANGVFFASVQSNIIDDNVWKSFDKCDYNNSEQQALIVALEYIFNNKDKWCK